MKQLFWIVGWVFVMTCFSVFADSAEIQDTSIEVGFSQDGEPEPHFLITQGEREAKLARVEKGSEPSEKAVPVERFAKRFQQALEDHRIFTAKQVAPKKFCKDKYILKVKQGEKTRERRGCSNQGNDVFAGFTQNLYRDAFQAWMGKPAELEKTVHVANE